VGAGGPSTGSDIRHSHGVPLTFSCPQISSMYTSRAKTGVEGLKTKDQTVEAENARDRKMALMDINRKLSLDYTNWPTGQREPAENERFSSSSGLVEQIARSQLPLASGCGVTSFPARASRWSE